MIRNRIIVLLVCGILAALIAIFAYYEESRKWDSYLTRYHWCTERVIFKGKSLKVRTLGISLAYSQDCQQSIEFDTEGSMSLPGINTYRIRALWGTKGDKLIISNAEELDSIYSDTYQIEAKNMVFTLRGRHTVLKGHIERPYSFQIPGN